jgi:hypothetical protein
MGAVMTPPIIHIGRNGYRVLPLEKCVCVLRVRGYSVSIAATFDIESLGFDTAFDGAHSTALALDRVAEQERADVQDALSLAEQLETTPVINLGAMSGRRS